jgi:hypothetical protein
MPEAHSLLLQLNAITAFEQSIAGRNLPDSVARPFHDHRENLIARWSAAQRVEPCNCTRCA